MQELGEDDEAIEIAPKINRRISLPMEKNSSTKVKKQTSNLGLPPRLSHKIPSQQVPNSKEPGVRDDLPFSLLPEKEKLRMRVHQNEIDLLREKSGVYQDD